MRLTPKFKKSWYTVYVFSVLNTKRFFRDRMALFFGILFPLIFLAVFGGIFGSSNSNVSFNVGVINQSQTDASQQISKQLADSSVLKIDKTITSENLAYDKMSRSQLDATIIIPKTFGDIQANGQPSGEIDVKYTNNNAQAGQTLTSILQQQIQPLNAQFVDTAVPFTVKGEENNQKSLTQFDYVFSGLLGFSVLGIGIFGPINVFPELKKQGILRRLHTTPLKVWQYFVSTMVSQAIIGLVSLTIMFIVAITVFNLNVVGNYFEIGLFLVLSIITILGIGLAIGGWAKNERQAAPLSNIIVFPMMFLSGTFFPRFLMPEWLQNASNYLPLTPVVDGIRLLSTEGQHFVNILPQLGLMGAWMLVIYFVAFRVFRWE